MRAIWMPRRVASRLCISGLLAAALCAVTAPRAVSAQQERPQLSAGRVTGELVAGTYAGIGGFLIGRFAGEGLGDVLGVTSEDTRRRMGYTTGALVGGLATAGAVFGIGNIGDETGDFAATYLGTGVGFVAGWSLSRAILGPAERPRTGMSTAARWATANVLAILPALGGTIGFNSSRRIR